MSPALLSWLLGITTTLAGGLATAVVTGALVPGSRVDKAEAVAEVRKETNEALSRTNTVQAELIQRLEAGSDVLERLVTALKAATIPQAGGN